MTKDRAEFLKKYSDLQDTIDYLLEQKERVEIDYIKARTLLNKLNDQLERSSKEMIRLFIESHSGEAD